MEHISVETKIINHCKKCGRGIILFPSDFARYGEQKAVNKAFERLIGSGQLVRIAHGIYCYPKVDKVLGLGILYPSLEDVATAIAKRDKARIEPTGLYAMNRLGFSTQIPMNVVYLTDGYNRKINLYNGSSITFKHAAPKSFAFKSHLAMLLTFAFKSLGKENITEVILSKTKELLAKDEKQVVKQDYKLMPAWVSSIIKSLYGEEEQLL